MPEVDQEGRLIYFPYGTNHIVYTEKETVKPTDKIYYKGEFVGTLNTIIDEKNSSKNSDAQVITLSNNRNVTLPRLGEHSDWTGKPGTEGGKKYKRNTKNKLRNKRRTKRNSRK